MMKIVDYRRHNSTWCDLTAVLLDAFRSPLSIGKHKRQSDAGPLLRSPLGEAAWSPSGSAAKAKSTICSKKTAGGLISGGTCGASKVRLRHV